MKPSLALHMSQYPALATPEARQRALTVALNIAKGTPLEPRKYERMMLDQFVRGELTLGQVLERLEQQ